MKQYKISSFDLEKNKKTPIQFFELKKKPQFEHLYFGIERSYIEIINEIIGNHKKYYFEFDCSLYSEDKLFDFYSKEEILFYKHLINLNCEDKIEINKNQLNQILTFVLREHLNGSIINENEEVLFGYIYDFESLVYSDNITEENIKEINKKGFNLEEFYFSFDFE